MEFCSDYLGCKISVDKPSVDGYEVSNLISSSQMGFVGESFVRPPSTIKIDFPLPIDIANIQLETQVGERKVTGFKLSTRIKREEKEESQHLSSGEISKSSTNRHPYVGRRVPASKYLDHRNGSFRKSPDKYEEEDEFFLGKWFSVKESKVFLKNYHYRHWLSLPLQCEDSKVSGHFTGALRNANRKALSSVYSLTLTILSVSPSGPPVLNCIKVWGQPSLTTSPSQKNKIMHLWETKRKQSLTSAFSGMYGSREEQPKELESQAAHHDLPESIVPDEFLDPLTCEMMKLPVLLPSGNSIDSDSLEKFVAHEATWGRPASDPFTGVPFKGNFRPEPNVHLKVRIDRFLLIEKDLPQSLVRERGHIVSDAVPVSVGSETTDAPSAKRRKWTKDYSAKKKILTVHSSKDDATSESSSSKSINPSHSESSTSTTAYKKSSRTNSSSSISTALALATDKESQLKKSFVVGKAENAPKSNSRHSLIRSLGSAVSSTSMVRRSVVSRVEVKEKTQEKRGDSVDASQSSSGQVSSRGIRDYSKWKDYSLESISANALKCVCGNASGVFYSLKCEHHICSSCLTLQTGLSTSGGIKCGNCHQMSTKSQLCRAHPKSAFAL